MDSTTTLQATKWTIHYDLPKNPLTLNPRRAGAWRAAAKHTKRIRNETHIKALGLHIPILGRCTVQLTWYVLTNGRRDVDNLAKLEKAMCDGLVDAQVCLDDIPEIMTKKRPRIVKVERSLRSGTAYMELVISPTTEPLLIVGTSAEAAEHWANRHGITADQYEHISTPEQLMGRPIPTERVRVILPPANRRRDEANARATLIAQLDLSEQLADLGMNR